MSKVKNASKVSTVPATTKKITGKQEPVLIKAPVQASEPVSVKPAKQGTDKKAPVTLSESLTVLLGQSKGNAELQAALDTFATQWAKVHSINCESFNQLIETIDNDQKLPSALKVYPRGHMTILNWWFNPQSKKRGYHVVMKPALTGRIDAHDPRICPLWVATSVKELDAIKAGEGAHLAFDGNTYSVHTSREAAHKALKA